jgi:hypothetical protein
LYCRRFTSEAALALTDTITAAAAAAADASAAVADAAAAAADAATAAAAVVAVAGVDGSDASSGNADDGEDDNDDEDDDADMADAVDVGDEGAFVVRIIEMSLHADDDADAVAGGDRQMFDVDVDTNADAATVANVATAAVDAATATADVTAAAVAATAAAAAATVSLKHARQLSRRCVALARVVGGVTLAAGRALLRKDVCIQQLLHRWVPSDAPSNAMMTSTATSKETSTGETPMMTSANSTSSESIDNCDGHDNGDEDGNDVKATPASATIVIRVVATLLRACKHTVAFGRQCQCSCDIHVGSFFVALLR